MTKKEKDQKQIADFLYEIGTMRKIMRAHRQVLLTDDMSDSISSHSYRVAIISWFLAKKTGADPYKTVMMSLLHDVPEARSNDHNWVHKKYVTVYEDEISKEQTENLPYKELKEFVDEYEDRESQEAILAKDADLLDQILLLKEYDWIGNKEATIWLYAGKGKEKSNAQLKRLKTKAGKDLGQAIYNTNPSDWWKNLWTPNNRK